MLSLTEAQQFYLRKLLESLKGNYAALKDYLLISNGTYINIQGSMLRLRRGIWPKISVWTNGGETTDRG